MTGTTDWLKTRVEDTPDSTALIFEGQVLNWADLDARVDEMVGWLVGRGIGHGDRVASILSNTIEYVVLVHAFARLGAVMVPINTRLTGYEIEVLLKQADVDRVLFYDACDVSEESVHLIEIPASMSKALTGGVEDTGQIMRAARILPFDEDRVQSMIFTSGTTGTPKGAMLTFANHRASAEASAERLGISPDDRWLAAMPLYSVGGQAILFRSVLDGFTVMLHLGFELEEVSRAIDHDGVTIVSLVPTMLKRLLDYREGRPFPESLRLVLLGGSAAPSDLVERCITDGVPIATTYGLTEAASQVATATPAQVVDKPGTVGQPMPGTSVTIVNDAGEALPPGEVGEIVVEGPTVMQGYLGQEPSGGRIATGDLGYLDEDGDLWVLSRRTDLIISGGLNVYPAEVEAVLRSHPQVQEAFVFGKPDEDWGQQVAVIIVTSGDITESDLSDYCRERLAGYKLPRSWQFVDKIPETSTGKVDRRAVKSIVMITRNRLTGI